ncbi:hypothetical protein [Caproiciproducens sp. LBM24188]|nr:hypothetical protein [Clostridiales bacterium]
MIRNATEKDASRIAEILIFSKRVAYRSIFQNDKVSFGEMQVLPLAMEYIKNPELLEHIFVYDDEKHHFRATTEKALEKGTEEYIIQYRNSL